MSESKRAIPQCLFREEAVHGQFSWAAEGAWNLVFG